MEQSGTALAPIDITVVTILWTLRLATKAKYTATVIAASVVQHSLTHITRYFQTACYLPPLWYGLYAITVMKKVVFHYYDYKCVENIVEMII